jgi:uncharacterized protein with FMN-binding domain
MHVVIMQLKKILLVAAVAILFALYAFQERPQSIAVDSKTLAALQSSATAVPSSTPPPSPTPSATSSEPPPATSEASGGPAFSVTGQPTATEPPPTATSTIAPPPATATATRSGAYADGVYTGSQEDAHWGNVTVAVTISNGMLSVVQFLEYPNHRNRSVEINDYAIPELIQEAIQAQSAEVDLVSGATDTSRAYLKSLETALQQAQS